MGAHSRKHYSAATAEHVGVAKELRKQSWTFRAIAKYLEVSVNTAEKMVYDERENAKSQILDKENDFLERCVTGQINTRLIKVLPEFEIVNYE